ncbi:ABC transporter permease [Ornithinimicrobium cavernae]|uniref:ABC transporter permease n=1 Tax=Ornithinimicrobium cavernae TaxID=2666047 RepID=UPI000D68E73F|nr:ABC transporter permease [Ornithinimicrobium cavernae]
MARYIAVRLALAVGVLWAAYTVSFVILYLVPGDPVAAMASGGQEGTPVSAAELAAMRAEYGFDDPLLVQYGSRLWSALQGDFGASIQTGQSVTAAIASALPNTAQLAGSAFVLAVVLGVGLALVATFTQVRWLKQFLLGLPPVGVSLPTFWVGLVLVQWFSFQLGWLPALGEHGWRSLVLPAITLAIPIGAILAQVTASCLQEALDEPYIVTARATGITRRAIHLQHALRNAALPVLTVAGLVVGGLLAGSVVVETVFSRAGVGRLTVTSVGFQDLPVVQGIVVFAAAIFVIANLVVDLLLPLADPRVTVGKARA